MTRAIVAGRVKVLPGGHLELPDGLQWPVANHPILFVRSVYAPLYESVLQRFQPVAGKSPRHIITGQPGIGKSVFGYVNCPSAGHLWCPR